MRLLFDIIADIKDVLFYTRNYLVFPLLRWQKIKQKSPKVIATLGLFGFGGGWWIRTTEGIASRFTVCPLWPLGKSPIFRSTVCLEPVDGLEPPTY